MKLNPVDFYIGETGSYFDSDGNESRILFTLKCILTAQTKDQIDALEEVLKNSSEDFIRSDSETRLLAHFDILNKYIF